MRESENFVFGVKRGIVGSFLVRNEHKAKSGWIHCVYDELAIEGFLQYKSSGL